MPINDYSMIFLGEKVVKSVQSCHVDELFTEIVIYTTIDGPQMPTIHYERYIFDEYFLRKEY